MGLGDAIICNGLVRTLAEQDEVRWPCHGYFYKSVSSMFEDLPQVKVFPVPAQFTGFNAANYLIPDNPGALVLGFAGKNFDHANWVLSFYYQAGLSYETRWEKFKLPERWVPKEWGIKRNFVLIHEDVRRGYRIDRSRLPKGLMVKPVQFSYSPLWNYLTAIAMAKEIHCIDSCVSHLVDSFYQELAGTPLVFHRYARRDIVGSYRGNWRDA